MGARTRELSGRTPRDGRRTATAKQRRSQRSAPSYRGLKSVRPCTATLLSTTIRSPGRRTAPISACCIAVRSRARAAAPSARTASMAWKSTHRSGSSAGPLSTGITPEYLAGPSPVNEELNRIRYTGARSVRWQSAGIARSAARAEPVTVAAIPSWSGRRQNRLISSGLYGWKPSSVCSSSSRLPVFSCRCSAPATGQTSCTSRPSFSSAYAITSPSTVITASWVSVLTGSADQSGAAASLAGVGGSGSWTVRLRSSSVPASLPAVRKSISRASSRSGSDRVASSTSASSAGWPSGYSPYLRLSPSATRSNAARSWLLRATVTAAGIAPYRQLVWSVVSATVDLLLVTLQGSDHPDGLAGPALHAGEARGRPSYCLVDVETHLGGHVLARQQLGHHVRGHRAEHQRRLHQLGDRVRRVAEVRAQLGQELARDPAQRDHPEDQLPGGEPVQVAGGDG